MLDGGAADLVLNNQLAGVIQLSTCSNEVLGLKGEADSRTQLIRLATVGDKADLGGADVSLAGQRFGLVVDSSRC